MTKITVSLLVIIMIISSLALGSETRKRWDHRSEHGINREYNIQVWKMVFINKAIQENPKASYDVLAQKINSMPCPPDEEDQLIAKKEAQEHLNELARLSRSSKL